MRLSEATPHIVATLGQNTFLSGIEILSTIEPAFNQRLETALRKRPKG